MSKLVRGIGKVFKKIAPIALPIAGLALPGVGSLVGGTLGSVVSAGSKALSLFSTLNSLSGDDRQKYVEENGAVLATQRRQEILLKQQEAQVKRDRVEADRREEELDTALANQKNAALARRRGRGGRAFAGPQTGLKTTFGG